MTDLGSEAGKLIPPSVPQPQPKNGVWKRRVLVWGGIGTISGALISVILLIKMAAPYRPVTMVEMNDHIKAEAQERGVLKKNMDEKINACLDEIAQLRKERNEELRKQNELLRNAVREIKNSNGGAQ